MPTGYTSDIEKGISFKEYALRCARGMGALILMRDDPWDAPIPDSFEPSDYHSKELARAKQEKRILQSASPEDISQMAQTEFEESCQWHEEKIAKNKELKKKYEAMLEKATAYKPPTKDHVGFKEFMISQIAESIKWDCNNADEAPPVLKTNLEYVAEKSAKIQWDIDYHTKELAAEIRRTDERNAWVKALKESLH